mmetsp:Transcript_23828/g.60926  ORF Transcript_23828/g.60926 Transcript_23828/m.60926 type:complete len:221 (-) Transcript_23828:12-674(-)
MYERSSAGPLASSFRNGSSCARANSPNRSSEASLASSATPCCSAVSRAAAAGGGRSVGHRSRRSWRRAVAGSVANAERRASAPSAYTSWCSWVARARCTLSSTRPSCMPTSMSSSAWSSWPLRSSISMARRANHSTSAARSRRRVLCPPTLKLGLTPSNVSAACRCISASSPSSLSPPSAPSWVTRMSVPRRPPSSMPSSTSASASSPSTDSTTSLNSEK